MFGTSPRMRGKHGRSRAQPRRSRNIPAYAGKTSEKRIILTGCWEHPRVCGENLPFATGAKPFPGTSPRMRGKRGENPHGGGRKRNIPAYAGKTPWKANKPSRRSEHPRVCRENPGFGDGRERHGGTSPRMRGKLSLAGYFLGDFRNIPVYAGKTRFGEAPP